MCTTLYGCVARLHATSCCLPVFILAPQYIVECSAETFLPQYLGAYRLTISDRETYLLILRNVFSSKQPTHVQYDLKGSTHEREASQKELAKACPTLKDNDFRREGRRLVVGAEWKAVIMERLMCDVELLKRLKCMDYSLLVGITRTADIAATAPPTSPTPAVAAAGPATEESEHPYRIPPQPGHGEVYHMGLIDVLTRYGTRKQTAHGAKKLMHGVCCSVRPGTPCCALRARAMYHSHAASARVSSPTRSRAYRRSIPMTTPNALLSSLRPMFLSSTVKQVL